MGHSFFNCIFRLLATLTLPSKTSTVWFTDGYRLLHCVQQAFGLRSVSSGVAKAHPVITCIYIYIHMIGAPQYTRLKLTLVGHMPHASQC